MLQGLMTVWSLGLGTEGIRGLYSLGLSGLFLVVRGSRCCEPRRTAQDAHSAFFAHVCLCPGSPNIAIFVKSRRGLLL